MAKSRNPVDSKKQDFFGEANSSFIFYNEEENSIYLSVL
jgi:hypothetical protein